MVQVIAEVGSNWSTFEDAKDSIPMAKACGADAVKFQLFDDLDLYGRPPLNEDETNITGMYSWLDEDWLPKLKEKADACGIEFMCTAFSPEGYDLVNPLVKRHKIASAELTHKRILQKVNSFKKPVILSTGAATEGDIRTALELLCDCPVTLLYCVAAYPAGIVDLGVMLKLRATFDTPVGFSDHTTDWLSAPQSAVGYGATVIEKHFKIRDNPAWPDNGHALLPDQFKAMIRVINGKHESVIGPSAEEKDMVTQHRRRLVATKDIQVGELFKEGANFGIYRSLIPDTKALSGFAVDFVNGKSAKKAIKAGQGVGPDEVI